MRGERRLVRAGYRWHVFAYFPCNAAGVRVAVCRSPQGAERFASAFAAKNGVDVSWKLR